MSRLAFLVVLGGFVALACEPEALGSDPKVWIPESVEVPAAVEERAPYPFCGVTKSELPPRLAACILDAHKSGRPAELAFDSTNDTTRLIVIVRARPDGMVDLIYGTLPQGIPWLWEIMTCESLKASSGDSLG